jgi:hypothetical protein
LKQKSLQHHRTKGIPRRSSTAMDQLTKEDGLPITPPMGKLSKLSIPESASQGKSRPSSSSSSSLFLSSSPASAGGLFLSPPVTPVSSSKSPRNRNDIFSEDWTTSLSPINTTGRPAKERLKGAGLPGKFDQSFDVWDSEARKRRSGAWTWNSRTTSRSSTPVNNELRVNYSSILGRGLTSVVYSATLPTSETVAAKVPVNEQSRRILEREADVLTFLHSIPHSSQYIIPFYGKYSFDDTFALCLKMCPQTMQEYINAQSGSPAPVVTLEIWKSWLSTLLSAIDFIHDSGVLHNDIKPHNILLTSSLHPYLSDFAVSTSIYPLDLQSPPGMHILGTTVFTAPELLSAEDVPTTPESDIYSLGITMFVAATGIEPFGWTKSITQKIMLKKRGDVFAGTDVRMSTRMIEIIKGMCAVDRAHRWHSTQVRGALHEL